MSFSSVLEALGMCYISCNMVRVQYLDFKRTKRNQDLHIPPHGILVLGLLFRCSVIFTTSPSSSSRSDFCSSNSPCSSSGLKTLILIYEVWRLSDRLTGWVEAGDGEFNIELKHVLCMKEHTIHSWWCSAERKAWIITAPSYRHAGLNADISWAAWRREEMIQLWRSETETPADPLRLYSTNLSLLFLEKTVF